MAVTSVIEAVTNKVGAWLDAGVDLLPNIAVAVLVVAATWPLAKLAGRGVRGGLTRMSQGNQTQLPSLVGALIRVSIVATGLFVALGVLHLDKTVTSLLAGVGVIGLALGFAFQDIAANLISGVMLAMKKPFVAGEVIEYGKESGRVLRIDLRDTQIQRFTGEVVIVPNRRLLENELINVTKAGERRVDVEVGVSYDADLDLAERVCCEAVQGLDQVLDGDRAVQADFIAFGASSIDIRVRFWVDYVEDPGSYVRLRSEAIKAIKRAFDEHGLSIPFPIRTLEVPKEALAELARAA